MNALERLKAARQGKTSRLQTTEQEDVFDEVDESQYQAIVRKRLNDDFVVDDDGLGYVDYGLEDVYEEDDDQVAVKKVKKPKKEKVVKVAKHFKFLKDEAQNDGGLMVVEPVNDDGSDLLQEMFDEVDKAAMKRKVEEKDQPGKRVKFQTFAPEPAFIDPILVDPVVVDPVTVVESMDNVGQMDVVDSMDNMDSMDVVDSIEPDQLHEIEVAPNDGLKVKRQEKGQRKVLKPQSRKEQKVEVKMNVVDQQANKKQAEQQMSAAIVSNQSINGFSQRFLHNDKLLMYWLDASESRSGDVHLFGKVWDNQTQAFVSCCLTITNIKRHVYLLPREYIQEDGKDTDDGVDLEDIQQEIDQLMSKRKILKYEISVVRKKYAFEDTTVDVEADWVQLEYSYAGLPLPKNLTGRTFSHCFGYNTSALEQVLTQCKLMGPSWLEIASVQHSTDNVSWCRVEAKRSQLDQVQVLSDSDANSELYPWYCRVSPPLVVMSMSQKTIMNFKDNVNELAMVSFLVYNKVQVDGQTSDQDQASVTSYTIMTQLEGAGFPMGLQDVIKQKQQNVITVPNERGLLNYIAAMLHRIDPDVYVGHNFSGYGLDVLQNRMRVHKTDFWSRVGRLRRNYWPKGINQSSGGEVSRANKELVTGRLLCDTFWQGKMLIKASSYTLSSLAKQELKTDRPEVNFDKVAQFYESADDLLWLAQHTENDAHLAMRLVFHVNMIPLTKQVTNLAGNLWQRTLTSGRSDANEHLLLHEFINNGFIVPDKYWNSVDEVKSKGKGKKPAVSAENLPVNVDEDEEPAVVKKFGRGKAKFLGGLVLEPKKGLYDKYVLLLDFNSLYPSIIQEYNICFTTIDRGSSSEMNDETPELPSSSLDQGLLPRILATLVDRRRQVKGLMKNLDPQSPDYSQLNIRQQALKLIANTMYGCLGFERSRFYAPALAKLVTQRGREILQDTVKLAEETLDLNVIYGDTDSIMINTKTDSLGEVKQLGHKLKGAVNKKYRLLEIEMDGFFRRMLILKKKKYAAITAKENTDGSIDFAREVKGLDLVRRDWCGLSHDASDYVLDQILSDKDKEDVVNNIHTYVAQLGNSIRDGKVGIEKYVINKQLTRALEDYGDAKGQPHVQVALRMKARGQSVKSGETVPYVICRDEDMSKSFALRAQHPDDVRNNGFEIDTDWYLNIQIHPPLSRLCQPIEGTSDGQLAECLGIDSTKYKQSARTKDDEELSTLSSRLPDSERFKDAERLKVECRSCGMENLISSPIRFDQTSQYSCLMCSGCNTQFSTLQLQQQLNSAIRKHIRLYGSSWAVCDENSCEMRSRQKSVYAKCPSRTCNGQLKLEYSAGALFNQLSFFAHLFDSERIVRRADKKDKEVTQALVAMHEQDLKLLLQVVDMYMKESARGVVDLKSLFSFQSKLTM